MSTLAKTKKRENIAVTVVALAVGIVLIFPFVYAFFGAFKTPPEFAAGGSGLLPESFLNFENFKEVFETVPLGRFFLNSIIVSVLGTLGRVVFAVMAAYAFTFYEFPGRNFFFYLLLGTMMIPPDTVLITNYLTVSHLGLIDTYLGMSIVSFVGASQMFMLRQKFRTLKRDFRDAAQMDGCGDFAFLWYILLPMARPILITLTVQSFVSLWNSYLWPLMVTTRNEMRTVQVGITMLQSIEDSNYTLVLAGVVLVTIPAFILFLILRKNIVKGLTTGAVVG